MRRLLFLLVFMLSVTPAFAAFNGPSDAYKVETSAAAALTAKEGATCILEGTIMRHLQKNRYLFKDASGDIVIDVPPHVFGALTVTPETPVRITGEMRGLKSQKNPDPHIAVRYLEIR